MLITQICTECDIEFKRGVIDDEDYTDSSPKLCQACKIVIETVHDPDAKFNTEFQLPLQSLYFHLNEDLLYDQKDVSKYATKNVLVIGTDVIYKRKRIKNLKSMGFKRLVCLCREKTWAFKLFDDWIYAEHADITKKEESLKAILEYQERHQIKFDSVFTYDEFYVAMTAFFARELNLPGIPFEVVTTIQNKYLFRQRCYDLKITCPSFFMVKSSHRMLFVEQLRPYLDSQFIESQDSVNGAKNRCYFPLILKNCYGCGKDFIRKCHNVIDVINSIEESFGYDFHILVEEFIFGCEVDLDILIQDNEVKFMAITDNFPAKAPFFFEQGCITPSINLGKREKALIERLVKKWIKLLQFQNACLHFEAICMKGSGELNENYFLMPVEINQRMGGAEAWSMIKAAYDVDLLREHMNISLGIKVDLDKKHCQQARNQCISWNFREEFDLYMESIKFNLAGIVNNADVIEVALTKSPGEKYRKDQYGWLALKVGLHCSELDMRASLEKVIECFKFNYKTAIAFEI